MMRFILSALTSIMISLPYAYAQESMAEGNHIDSSISPANNEKTQLSDDGKSDFEQGNYSAYFEKKFFK